MSIYGEEEQPAPDALPVNDAPAQHLPNEEDILDFMDVTGNGGIESRQDEGQPEPADHDFQHEETNNRESPHEEDHDDFLGSTEANTVDGQLFGGLVVDEETPDSPTGQSSVEDNQPPHSWRFFEEIPDPHEEQGGYEAPHTQEAFEDTGLSFYSSNDPLGKYCQHIRIKNTNAAPFGSLSSSLACSVQKKWLKRVTRLLEEIRLLFPQAINGNSLYGSLIQARSARCLLDR